MSGNGNGVAVSVICAFHNEAPLIGHTIDSINAQTFRDFEVIFVDDGSSDGTADIIRQAARFRFTILRNETNLGLAGSLNRGLAAAKAPLVARIDADDLMKPWRLECQAAAFAQDEELILLGGQAIKIDNDGRPFGTIRMPTGDRSCRFALNFYSPFVHPSVMFRRDDALAIGGYNDATFPAEDYDLWCRLAARGRIANLSQAVVFYRVRSSGSITSNKRAFQLQKHASVIQSYVFRDAPKAADIALQSRKILRLGIVMPWAGRRAMLSKALKLVQDVIRT
jgi:glycosyltransferase involved in cell wall biosynthesis